MVSDTRTIQADPLPDDAELPRWLRPVVYGFLAVVLICGLTATELWPFTGFRLYADTRDRELNQRLIVAELADGSEQVVDLRDLPLGWHNTNLLLRQFGSSTQEERDEVCAAWVAPLEDDGLDVVAVRIDQTTADLGDPHAPAEVVRTAFRCER